MADTFGTVSQKRDYYLQMMQKARKLNDQILIKLILKKLAHLGMTSVASTTSGCIIIPFPSVQCSTKFKEYERPTWWMLFKLTLAIPGSLAALFLLACYRVGPYAPFF
ncbi:MAG: hypothetical protein KAR17_20180 [Cyclobacteriaceae bacterium]|nr:hypothetical protein [Cyclobacteriaceae bacterium]